MKKLLLIVISIFIIATAIILILPPQNKKSTSTSVKNNGSLYDQQANKICSMLTKASELYKTKKYEEAAKTSDSAYWDVYDNIMEIKYRSFASPSDIFEVENKFHAYTDKLRIPYTPQNMSQIIRHKNMICDEMQKEAQILNKNS